MCACRQKSWQKKTLLESNVSSPKSRQAQKSHNYPHNPSAMRLGQFRPLAYAIYKNSYMERLMRIHMYAYVRTFITFCNHRVQTTAGQFHEKTYFKLENVLRLFIK